MMNAMSAYSLIYVSVGFVIVALAHQFIKSGSKVILAARSIDRLRQIKQELLEAHKVSSCLVIVFSFVTVIAISSCLDGASKHPNRKNGWSAKVVK